MPWQEFQLKKPLFLFHWFPNLSFEPLYPSFPNQNQDNLTQFSSIESLNPSNFVTLFITILYNSNNNNKNTAVVSHNKHLLSFLWVCRVTVALPIKAGLSGEALLLTARQLGLAADREWESGMLHMFLIHLDLEAAKGIFCRDDRSSRRWPAQTHFKPLLITSSLISHWPKEITWPRPTSKGGEYTFLLAQSTMSHV